MFDKNIIANSAFEMSKGGHKDIFKLYSILIYNKSKRVFKPFCLLN